MNLVIFYGRRSYSVSMEDKIVTKRQLAAKMIPFLNSFFQLCKLAISKTLPVNYILATKEKLHFVLEQEQVWQASP